MQYILIYLIITSNGILLTKNKTKKNVFRFTSVILIKVKVKSINYVALPYIALNTLRGDTIRLYAVYVCDDAHDEILETIFHGNNYITINLF